MSSRSVTVASSIGLHARVAARFVQRVAAWHLPVTLSRPDGPEVSADSMIAVMGLNIRHGENVVLTASGPGEDEVLDDLVAFLAVDHDAASLAEIAKETAEEMVDAPVEVTPVEFKIAQ